MLKKKATPYVQLTDNKATNRKQAIEKHLARLLGKEWNPTTVDFV
jgi:hypothetical protein